MSNDYRCGWLEKDTRHSINRAKERAGLNEKRAIKMMSLARKRGITSENCTWSIDRKFLESRSNQDQVAVAYNGYCYILDRLTMNCLTLYRLPKHFGKKKKVMYQNRYDLYEEMYA
ncbi:MAG: hypothetical protein K6G69_04000 [Lachnospiraceae bacterium]|nr:hypothetical protein [Lachnospiraceae bacterium]